MAVELPPELRETNRIFEEDVVGKGQFSSIERIYTRQARLLPPGAPMVTGHEAIRSFWQAAASDLGVTGLRLRTVELELHGDTAHEIGRAEIDMSQATAPVEVKYVVLWKREDGVWKWDVDIWNTNA